MKKLALAILLAAVSASVFADNNLSTCLAGKYPSLCDKSRLSYAQLGKVKRAELRENLKICLIGKYAALCKHDLLKGNEENLVRQAEAREGAKQVTIKVPARTTSRYTRSGGCESGHWVDSVSDDGGIVKLEDGSIWEVAALDTVDSMLWLPTTDITSCDFKLINTEDNETVDATRLK